MNGRRTLKEQGHWEGAEHRNWIGLELARLYGVSHGHVIVTQVATSDGHATFCS